MRPRSLLPSPVHRASRASGSRPAVDGGSIGALTRTTSEPRLRGCAGTGSRSTRNAAAAYLNDLCGYYGALLVAQLKTSHIQTWIEGPQALGQTDPSQHLKDNAWTANVGVVRLLTIK